MWRKWNKKQEILSPRSNVEWLYLPRSEGGRGLASKEDCANGEREHLALYPLKSIEKLIIAATAELNLNPNLPGGLGERGSSWPPPPTPPHPPCGFLKIYIF